MGTYLNSRSVQMRQNLLRANGQAAHGNLLCADVRQEGVDGLPVEKLEDVLGRNDAHHIVHEKVLLG
jgi:hypothetical protein